MTGPLPDKHYTSAFAGAPLASWLASHLIDTRVISGFSTSDRVRASAVDALRHGLRPMVVLEADRDPRPHDANLSGLDAKYADVVSLAEAAERLS
jgi:maleamate amidohydrolase